MANLKKKLEPSIPKDWEVQEIRPDFSIHVRHKKITHDSPRGGHPIK
jgi:hypothetical protein